MKEFKVTLLVIYTAAYTSLIWACAVYNWIPIPFATEQPFYLGGFLFIIFTLANLGVLANYCYNNWNK